MTKKKQLADEKECLDRPKCRIERDELKDSLLKNYSAREFHALRDEQQRLIDTIRAYEEKKQEDLAWLEDRKKLVEEARKELFEQSKVSFEKGEELSNELQCEASIFRKGQLSVLEACITRLRGER